jgi:hypothetical protein
MHWTIAMGTRFPFISHVEIILLNITFFCSFVAQCVPYCLYKVKLKLELSGIFVWSALVTTRSRSDHVRVNRTLLKFVASKMKNDHCKNIRLI